MSPNPAGARDPCQGIQGKAGGGAAARFAVPAALGIPVLAAEGFCWQTLGVAFLLPQGFPWLSWGGFGPTLPCQGQALHGHCHRYSRARKVSVAGKSNKNECSSGKSPARHEHPSKLINVLAGFVADRFALLLKSSV